MLLTRLESAPRDERKGLGVVAARMQIGEVAERTGLSQRTIRYYGEVGPVSSSKAPSKSST